MKFRSVANKELAGAHKLYCLKHVILRFTCWTNSSFFFFKWKFHQCSQTKINSSVCTILTEKAELSCSQKCTGSAYIPSLSLGSWRRSSAHLSKLAGSSVVIITDSVLQKLPMLKLMAAEWLSLLFLSKNHTSHCQLTATQGPDGTDLILLHGLWSSGLNLSPLHFFDLILRLVKILLNIWGSKSTVKPLHPLHSYVGMTFSLLEVYLCNTIKQGSGT